MIETSRLLMRPPAPEDRPWLRSLLADPVAMELIGPRKTEAEADEVLDRHIGWFRERGLGFMAVLRRDDGAGMGFCGLKPGAEGTPIEGEVEIGWMLSPAYWRRGYGLEATAALLDWGWATTDAAHIYAITSAINLPSQALMERLGMRRLVGGDFESPRYTLEDPRRPSVTFAIGRPA